jgi:hypothetical protein
MATTAIQDHDGKVPNPEKSAPTSHGFDLQALENNYDAEGHAGDSSEKRIGRSGVFGKLRMLGVESRG